MYCSEEDGLDNLIRKNIGTCTNELVARMEFFTLFSINHVNLGEKNPTF